jgi:hypothetical protein
VTSPALHPPKINPPPLYVFSRYVADLFGRLQRAEWALAIARRRALAWGYSLLVPSGSCDRSIQTHPAEVWASGQRQVSAPQQQPEVSGGTAAPAMAAREESRPGSSSGSSGGGRLPALAPRVRASSAGAALCGGSAVMATLGSSGSGSGSSDPLAAMSPSTLRASLSELPGLGGGFIPADGRGPVPRVARTKPAFTDHSRGLMMMVKAAAPSSALAPAKSMLTEAPRQQEQQSDWRSAVARRLLEAGKQQTAQASSLSNAAAASSSSLASAAATPLGIRALLSKVAAIYMSKADAEAKALRQQGRTAGPLAAFVLADATKDALGTHGGRQAGFKNGSRVAPASNIGGSSLDPRVFDALTLLVMSIRHHAGASSKVARFGEVLGCLGPLEALAAVCSGGVPLAAAFRGLSSSQHSVDEPESTCTAVGEDKQPTNSRPGSTCARRRAVAAQGPRLRFPALLDSMLVSPAVAAATVRAAARPGMELLLEWVATGAFLGHLHGADELLGRPLLDVQVGRP